MHWLATVPLPPLDEHSLLVFWCQVLIVLTLARAGGYLLRLLGQQPLREIDLGSR
jgi:hypothetical protein